MRMLINAFAAFVGIILTVVISTAVYASTDTTIEDMSDSRYYLTNNERKYIEYAVYHEAGNQSYAGQMLIAECILNACERSEVRPREAMSMYGYHNQTNCDRYAYKDVTQSCKDAVRAVFDDGYVVWKGENPIWFYSPANMPNGYSEDHEKMRFIGWMGGHKFFGE